MSRTFIRCCQTTDLYFVKRLAEQACNLGWELVSISLGKLGSLSHDAYLITLRYTGETEPELPKDWNLYGHIVA